MDTHIIHIQDAHSPPLRINLTTSAKQQTQQQPYGPAGMLGQNSELSPRHARHHPLSKGYRQAYSVLGPDRGQSQEFYPGMRHRDCSKNQYQVVYCKEHLFTVKSTCRAASEGVDTENVLDFV